jgi:hypothetical protein
MDAVVQKVTVVGLYPTSALHLLEALLMGLYLKKLLARKLHPL